MARRTKAVDALETYRSKRDFVRTPEPRGKVGAAKGRLYTIQKHAARRLHYDLRLELDGVLKSWAITRGPSFDPTEKRLAVRTEDHPLEYARFEGRIPEGGYGAGSVLVWDQGEWLPIEEPHEGLERGKLSFELLGERLTGRWALIRMRARNGEKRENWLLVKERDAHAKAGREPTEEFTDSVQSAREMEAVRAAPHAVWENGTATRKKGVKKQRAAPRHAAPDFVAPALARLVDEVPHGEGWLFEVKLDGYRTIASVSGADVRLFTRSGLDWTERYGSIARALAALDLDGVLLDGEVVSVDTEGRTDFSTLQAALKEGRGGLSYFVFDLLAEGGRDLLPLPQVERKRRLRELLARARDPLHYADHLEHGGDEMLRALCDKGFEGLIAKRADAPYKSGRIGVWLKVKCERAQEFAIVGWTPSTKHRAFASLLLGVHEDGELRYAGRVGAGFKERDLEEVGAKLGPLERMTPTVEGVPGAIARGARWVRPDLVAQIEFAEFTRDGSVRHARFIALRSDKASSEIVRERPANAEEMMANDTKQKPKRSTTAKKRSGATATDGEERVAGVRLTSGDRVLYPKQGLAKRDLALYLEAAAERMLPHVGRRLVSLVRCPEGRTGECFFQRHVGKGMPEELRTFELEESNGRTRTYFWLDGTAGLVATAQVGALEIHLWGSSIDDVERPDRLVMDLDPDPSVDFEAVKVAASEMAAALDALGIQSFPLVTGGKGVHVVAPIRRTLDFATLKAFTRALAERFAEQDPSRFVATMSKARRKGKIFVDYLRNDRTSTAIAPYSARAREGAPVAMPVTWKELASLDRANSFDIQAARRRLTRADPWKGYFDLRQTVTVAALDAVGVER